MTKPPVVESVTVREMRTPRGEAELPTHVCATHAGPTHVSTAEPAEVPTTTAVSATTAVSTATSGDCGDGET
jgi:hypothetical protein